MNDMNNNRILYVLMACLLIHCNQLAASEDELPINAKSLSSTYNHCLLEYKKCATKILDTVDTFYKTYEHDEEQCKEHISEITDTEYDYVTCQDQLGICMEEEKLTSDRIYQAETLSLIKEDPKFYGLNDNVLKIIRDNATSIPKLKSLLISRDNELVFEEYYSNKNDPRPHHVWSITKSVMSLLVGIAIDNDYIQSEKELIHPYFPDYFEQSPDSLKSNITIEHVLAMTTGINFTDNNNWNNWSSYEPYVRDDNARDWILKYEMLLNYQPGEIWLYGSPNTDLLSTIISTSTGMTTLEFANKYLFEPLNIQNYLWLHDSSQNYVGGFTLYLRPRALMKIGQMVLNGGMYNNKRVVSDQWITKSLSSHVELGGEDGYAYGYLWWRFRVGNYQVISAFGYGGQLITMVPELNLVVVTTSDSHAACTIKSVEDQFNAVLNMVREVILNIKR